MNAESTFLEFTTRASANDLLTDCCELQFEGLRVAILTNSDKLIEALVTYFGPLAKRTHGPPNSSGTSLELWAVDAAEPKLALDYCDWPRELGKSGRKEEFAPLGQGRVVRKVRTGMHFYVDAEHRIAFGPCVTQVNQVVNFINAQVIAHFMAEGHQLCHAAAVYLGDHGVMIAAASGAGKSTLAMHLMAKGAHFTSNDRLLVKRQGSSNHMLGVPKWPRINPGTILNNPALTGILSPNREKELQLLPQASLWELEEKYDVPVADLFGPERIKFGGPLSLLVLLDWSHTSTAPTTFTDLNLEQHGDQLRLLVKNAGPLVYDPAMNEAPQGANRDFDWNAYQEALGGVPVLLCEGSPDFPAALREIERRTDQSS